MPQKHRLLFTVFFPQPPDAPSLLCCPLAQATAVTAAAQAAADATAVAAAEAEASGTSVGSGAVGGVAGAGGGGESTARAFELYKLSHNIKKMLGESVGRVQ